MSQAVRVNATIDRELLRRVDAFAAQRYEDRSTAIPQLVDFALRELHKREAVDSYRSGRVTLRQFAEALGLDVWSAHDLLRTEGVAVAQGLASETSQSLRQVSEALGATRHPTV
jgi:predicted HTH domain antitoxin